MNAWPLANEWLRFVGTLAVELLVVFAAAKLFALATKSAQAQRAVWQVALCSMLLIFIGELNGLSRWLPVPHKRAASPASTQRAVVITLEDGPNIPAALAPPTITAEEFFAAAPGQSLRWPAVLWVVGSVLVLLRLGFAEVAALVIRHRSRRIEDAELAMRVSRIAASLGIRREATLLENSRVLAPFTFGAVTPAIVLPRDFARTFTPAQQDAVIAHELAHVAGHDFTWRRVGEIVCALLWWHPVIWLSKRELHHACELVADEASLLRSDGPQHLAECLLVCAKQMRRRPFIAWLGADGGGFRSKLGKRVARLMNSNPVGASRRVPWPLRFVGVIGCVTVLSFCAAIATRSNGGSAKGWRQSILGSAFAALAEQPTNVAEAAGIQTARLIQEGKLANETGRLDAAISNPVQSAEPVPLHTRFFKVDMNTLWQSLSNVTAFTSGEARTGGGGGIRSFGRGTNGGFSYLRDTNSAVEVIPALKSFFQAAGVDLNVPGKAIFFHDRLGYLMVRATIPDLDTIEKAVAMLNFSPPQLTINAKVVEVEITPKRPLESWYPPKSIVTNAYGGDRVLTAILDDDQFRAVIRNMEKNGGTDILSCPTLTTMSGRQAQIKVVDVRYIVTDMQADTNNATGKAAISPITEPFEFGPVVNVVPYVAADGYSIQMTMAPRLREFLGYEDPTKLPDHQLWAVGGKSEDKLRSPVPLPRFRLREVASTANVLDGQTIMLSGGKVRNEERIRDNGKVSTNYTDKALFYFITPRLIDNVGNPLHTDESLRKIYKKPRSTDSTK